MGDPGVVDASARNTWVLAGFTAVTNLTDGVTKVVLPLFATSLTSSPTLISGVLLSLTLPWLFAALPVGVLVDRADRRGLLWLANGMRVAAVAGLLAAISTDVITLPILYGGAVVLGVAEVIALTAAAAIIPDAVAPAGRDRVNTWVTGAETVCNELAGPFVGGLLVAAGVAFALGASAVGYLLSMAVLPMLIGRFKIKQAVDAPSVGRQLGEGLRFLWRQRLLRLFVLSVSVLVTCWAAWYALMPLVATRRWGLSPIGYGTLAGSLGVGGLVGAVAVGTANRLFGRRRVMFANIFLTSSMVAAPAVTSNVWVAGGAAFLGGMGGTLWVVNARSIGQQLVDPAMMGRYNSTSRLFSWGSIPLGAALAGGLAEVFDYRVAFAVFAAASLTIVIPFVRVFTPAMNTEVEYALSTRGVTR